MSESDTTLCILGASGDLTSRSLLPALAELLAEDPERRVHSLEWKAVRGLALRHRDLCERLSAPQILGQGLPVDLEVGKRSVEHGADGLGGRDAGDPRRVRC